MKLIAFWIFSILLILIPVPVVRFLLSISEEGAPSEETSDLHSIIRTYFLSITTDPKSRVVWIGCIGIGIVNLLLLGFVVAAWKEGPFPTSAGGSEGCGTIEEEHHKALKQKAKKTS